MNNRQGDGKAHLHQQLSVASTLPAIKLAIGALACLSLMLGNAAYGQTMTAAATSPAGASGGTQSCGEATGPTSCGASGPASKNDKTVDEGGGNPINVITGNKYQREVDLPALPGVLGLELVRHYNSQFSGVGFPNGIMGRGWKLSYETELHVVGRALQIVQADGARLIFNRDLLNPSDCGTSRVSDGRIVIRRGPRGDEYVWTWPNGRRLSFDHRGKLVQIAAPTGEFVTLQHDARGHLVQVTDPQGRQLKLNYAEPARSIDTPVGRYVYEYGSIPPKGTQIDKIQLAANLVKVHLPTHYEPDKPAHPLTSRGTTSSSISRAYHYEDARFPTLLTGISVSGSGSDGKPLNQRISTYGYDQRAWAVRSEHGGQKVELALLERASLSEMPGSTPGRSVLVHGRTAAQPEGRRLEIRSAMVAGDYRITETRGEPCVAALPCPRANMRYRYDAKGRLTEEIQLDQQGRALMGVRTAYDPMDRVVRVSQLTYKEGKPGAERWMVRYEYGATGEQPTLIAKPSVVASREHQTRLAYNEQGQVLSIEESGYSPLNAQGHPVAQPDQASPIKRITRYEYGRINGRSVLAAADGALPGTGDTIRYQWDKGAAYLQAAHLPLGMTHRWTQRDEAGRVTQEVPADGVAVARQYLPTGEAAQWRRGGAQARAEFDALIRPTRIELPGGEVQRITYFDSMKGTQGIADGIAQAVALTSNRGQMRWLVPPVQPEPSAQAEPGILDARVPPTAAEPRSPTAAWPDSSGWVDDFGRLVALHTRETGTETREYDESNRLVQRTLADGSTWHWQRDALGRITEHTVRRPSSVAQRTRLHYKGVHLARIEHPHEQEQLAYDGLGRLSQRTMVRQAGKGLAGLHATERYDHDEADRLLAWHLPEGGSLRYEWGVGSQLKALRHRDGRAEAVLGQTVGEWLGDRLGVGQRTVIEPWPASGQSATAGAATPRSAMAAKDASGQDTARDAFALPTLLQSEQGYRWGNGVALRWHLNAQGQLARMRWEQPDQQASWLDAWMTAWLPQARAQASQAARAGASAASAADLAMAQPVNPRAPMLMQTGFGYDLLGRMRERSLEEQGGALQRLSFAYDGRGRLLLAQPADSETAAVQPDALQPEYYAYDAQGRLQAARWQGQDHDWRGVDVRRDATGLPQRIGGVPGQPERLLAYSADRRLTEVRQAQVGSTASALLASYIHNTHGLRITKTVYGPGGEAKSAHHTQYLWQGLKLVAETRPQTVSAKDAKASSAKLARRYVYAHNVPVAVIDYADGAELQEDEDSISAWFIALWRWVSADGGELRFVHANEIGTPVAVTDAKARVIWRAKPTAYGVVGPQTVAHTAHTSEGFALNLRLLGQYFDAETGWHDNVLRTYDPQRGEYLEPDPLGPLPNWQSGQLLTQPYAYANHNPSIYADPFGLILFAFDGTDNTDDADWLQQRGSVASNVVEFRNAYDITANGSRHYVTGVGTDHVRRDNYGDIISSTYDQLWGHGIPDRGGNYSGPDRMARMRLYFNDEADKLGDNEVMQVDIIGFSRGAAQARHFANQVVAATTNGWYRYQVHDPATGRLRFDAAGRPIMTCQRVNFRFMGLWDTVLSTNRSGTAYNLAIPAAFSHVAQAVALNEYRGAPNGENTTTGALGNFRFWDDTRIHLDGDNHYGGFPLESIGASSNVTGRVRIERGFIGAHADIGGGYGDNNGLSTVALAWMVGQAQIAGVTMNLSGIQINMNNAALHDQSNVIRFGNPRTAPPTFEVAGMVYGTNTRVLEDRRVNGGLGGGTQRTQTFGPAEAGGNRSMINADTHALIDYTARRPNNIAQDTRKTNDIPGLQGTGNNPRPSNITGTVDMQQYMNWLRTRGYTFAGVGEW